jgi:hypothetical protein
MKFNLLLLLLNTLTAVVLSQASVKRQFDYAIMIFIGIQIVLIVLLFYSQGVLTLLNGQLFLLIRKKEVSSIILMANPSNSMVISNNSLLQKVVKVVGHLMNLIH